MLRQHLAKSVILALNSHFTWQIKLLMKYRKFPTYYDHGCMKEFQLLFTSLMIQIFDHRPDLAQKTKFYRKPLATKAENFRMLIFDLSQTWQIVLKTTY